MTNAKFTQMENKQLKTEVLGEVFENEFQEFIIDATQEKGDYIVENAIDEMTTQGADTSILTDGETPSIAEISYDTKRKENYIYHIREDELKSVANDNEAFDALDAKIKANLDQQDAKNCWRAFPKIISRTTGAKPGQIVYSQGATDYAGAIIQMKADIRKIKEPSDLYNMYTKSVGGATKTLKNFSNDVVIFIRADFKDALEVNYLSGLYNLEKADIGAKIIPVPKFYTADGSAEDSNMLWLTCGRKFAKIYKHFEKRANLEDVRGYDIGKAVTYIEYVSKLVPAIWHTKANAPGK